MVKINNDNTRKAQHDTLNIIYDWCGYYLYSLYYKFII